MSSGHFASSIAVARMDISMIATTKTYTACACPVFIIGSPRSGTSALAWALAQSDSLWTSRETDILWNLFGGGRIEAAWKDANSRIEGNWLREQNVSRYEFLEHAAAGINALFTNRSGGRRWIDQTPLNTFMPDLLAEMFPSAKFLHMLRDGRRVVHSMINFGHAANDAVRLAMAQNGTLPEWARSFEDACQAWNMFTNTAMEFASRRPDRVLTIWNDQLSEDPDSGFDKIFSFLETECQPDCPKFFRQNRINSSFGADGFNGQPPVPRPSPWKAWTESQERRFEEVTAQLTQQYNLAWDQDGPMRPATWFERYQRFVLKTIGAGHSAAVVSRGDNSLLNLGSTITSHFPLGEDGGYAGYHPADSSQALEFLEAAIKRRTEFLIVPAPSMWWLDHYAGLSECLTRQYKLLAKVDDVAAVFRICSGNDPISSGLRHMNDLPIIQGATLRN